MTWIVISWLVARADLTFQKLDRRNDLLTLGISETNSIKRQNVYFFRSDIDGPFFSNLYVLQWKIYLGYIELIKIIINFKILSNVPQIKMLSVV